MALTFETYMASVLAEKRDANIEAVRNEVRSGNISKATRKKIATQAFKAGQNVERFISDIYDVRYAAAMVASDPKKQIKNKDIVKGYIELHGLTVPTKLETLIQEDDGGDQRKNRNAFIRKLWTVVAGTVIIVSSASPLDIDVDLQIHLEQNNIVIQTPDEYVESK